MWPWNGLWGHCHTILLWSEAFDSLRSSSLASSGVEFASRNQPNGSSHGQRSKKYGLWSQFARKIIIFHRPRYGEPQQVFQAGGVSPLVRKSLLFFWGGPFFDGHDAMNVLLRVGVSRRKVFFCLVGSTTRDGSIAFLKILSRLYFCFRKNHVVGLRLWITFFRRLILMIAGFCFYFYFSWGMERNNNSIQLNFTSFVHYTGRMSYIWIKAQNGKKQ